MIEEVKMDPEVNAEDIFRNKEINHNNVSSRTIRRYLDDNDFVARRMLNTHFISDNNKEKRV